ncbi:hypothetical protein [Geodermatophilus sp. FMUSA9-8]|uniref:hypothetical protein n=1 Tax=Geodermatophilus sp. FMUSA9-8 TaxID=3120155 RepID=UPI00300A0274
MTAGTAAAEPAVAAAPRMTGLRWAAAAATAAAAGLHVLAAVDHLGTSDLVVGFFLLTALAQFGAAAWLALGPDGARDPRFLTAVVTATAGLLLLYVVGHTTDLLDPFLGHDHSAAPGAAADHAAHTTATGPIALGTEPVEAPEAPVLGTLTAGAECLALVALAALLPTGARRRVLDGLFALGAVTWLLWLTGVLS